MDAIVVGIDVSKDKLDIAVRPGGAVFGASRDAAGRDAVIARLAPLSPAAVAVEATGGFETVVAQVAAEMIGAESGIGFLVLQSGNLNETTRLMVGLVVLSALGVLSSWSLNRLERLAIPWRHT